MRYDNDRQLFVAQVPELDNCKGEGPSRTEALAKAEEAVEKAFREAAEHGKPMPQPVDAAEFSGELNVKVSASLHRDLEFLAKKDGVELNQLVSEMLASGLAHRSGGQRSRERSSHEGGPDAQPREHGHDRGRGRGRGHRGGPRGGQGYFNVMDDRASFIEYVRNLEPGNRPPRRRGGGRDE
jgi:predicted HicB family RNase H-like nuclease